MQLTIRRAILIYTLVPLVVIFLISAMTGVGFLKSRIEAQVNEKMSELTAGYADALDTRLRRLAAETRRTAETLQAIENIPVNDLYGMLRLHVADDPVIYGAAIAFVPGEYAEGKTGLFAPYVFNSEDGVKQMDIAVDGYDYTDGQWEWWTKPAATGKPVWTEPYFDEGAGNILMTTFSAPFFDREGGFRGVVTLDIGLEELRDQRFGINHEQFALASQAHKLLYHFDPGWIGKPVDELVVYTSAITGLDTGVIAEQALSGEQGRVHIPVDIKGDSAWLFFAPVESTGWTLGLWMYDSKTFATVNNNLWRSILFFLLLLLMIVVAVFYLSKRFSDPIEDLVDQCRRMERLNFQPTGKVASRIEEIRHLATTLDHMRQALYSFSSVREDIRLARSIRQFNLPAGDAAGGTLDIAACSETSPEVGGESYDIADRGAGRTALMLVDAAGFGVDAAIRCVQLRAIFRSGLSMGAELDELARQMNRFLLDDVSGTSLAVVWLGDMDYRAGRLTWLAAGSARALHYSTSEGRVSWLRGESDPLGARRDAGFKCSVECPFAPGDYLVIASDGVLDAQDTQRRTFAVERMERVVAQAAGGSARQMMTALTGALADFTGAGDGETDRSLLIVKRTGEGS